MDTFRTLILAIVGVLKLVIPILYSVAFVVFFWSMAKIIMNSGNAVEVQKSKKYMFGAVIALFVLLTFNGIILLMADQVGFSSSVSIDDVLLPGAK